ncbi:hypothetical protein D0T25_17545 [Duganella sp. BJB488]|uniref:hypothetical protein n=1 Tax=unclassified Duganella TaxID=2636909 RepID=UPI000E344675|nr:MULTISPECIES: hypothetical protein [unclassified Duganella]RFP16782.1 hypothetical protein D0T26_17985 [Duganella sp. BJB489]RFP20796.1 hypothetical protein D0T25_17545 [Duganella sp. BJB488]RFP32144.1 hypothetical protein D0T24_21360 [Duganella sp. BJB480]
MSLIQRSLLLAMLAGAAAGASAQNANQPPPPPDGKRGPPQEAIDACKGKAEGVKVTFKGRRGEDVKGVCKKMREGVVAVPEGGMPPPPPDQRK